MVIKESLRVHNVVPFIGRSLEKPLTINSELLQGSEACLPESLNVVLPIGAQAFNPCLWENPLVCCMLHAFF